MSYSTFEYSNFKLSANTLGKGGNIIASVDVKNTSTVDGKEVVQLYIRDLYASVTRPVKELKGFELIELKSGETKTVTFTINEKTIEFYTVNKRWESEPGDFKVFVGGSSASVLEAGFNYSGQQTARP